ncbi:MAG: septum formation initiator [Lachnospiraceae bacterium]|nr:septum formation initiator [Lachnospiraceae bacterium]MCR5082007.1 septum formation initiator family protein [Parasporobacterium sp.]
MRRLKVKKKKKVNIGIITMLAVVCLMCIVFGSHMISVYHKNAELKKQEQALLDELEEQEQRQADLEEQKIYVQTKKYAEEVAKSIGYVYPDEIIFKATN